MLSIHSIGPRPVREILHLNAARRGGTETVRLPILRGVVSGLPDGLDGLVATSDLQGIVPDTRTRESMLLGVSVADVLEELGFEGAIPPAARMGVLLAGDLYAVPGANERGGYGDVSEVWWAFADRFAWVAGVAGNHDDTSAIACCDALALLDGDEVTLGGLRIGGVGWISGDPTRRGRRDEEEQLARIERAAVRRPDVLVLHEGPEGEGRAQPGHSGIRAIAERFGVPLTVCGHVPWQEPLATRGEVAVLNVHARVVVLARA